MIAIWTKKSQIWRILEKQVCFSSKYISEKEIIDQIFQFKKKKNPKDKTHLEENQTYYCTGGLLTDKFKALFFSDLHFKTLA